MIMSVVNWSVKMSVWEDERETDIERKEQKRLLVKNEVEKKRVRVRVRVKVREAAEVFDPRPRHEDPTA
jgi:hypothetical protein